MEEKMRNDEKIRGVLGDNLVYYRNRLGITQQQIADYLCLNRTTYTKYETGITEPNNKNKKKMADLFDITINDLLSEARIIDGVGDESELIDDIRTLNKLLRKLDPPERSRLIDIARDIVKESEKEEKPEE